MDLTQRTCPACGGQLLIDNEIATCQFCGNKYTVENRDGKTVTHRVGEDFIREREKIASELAIRRIRGEIGDLEQRQNDAVQEIERLQGVARSSNTASGWMGFGLVVLVIGGLVTYSGVSGGGEFCLGLLALVVGVALLLVGWGMKPSTKAIPTLINKTISEQNDIVRQIEEKQKELEFHQKTWRLIPNNNLDSFLVQMVGTGSDSGQLVGAGVQFPLP